MSDGGFNAAAHAASTHKRENDRRLAMEALRGSHASLEDTVLRMRIMLERQVDALWELHKRGTEEGKPAFDSELAKEERELVKALTTLLHEMRALEKDALFAQQNLSRDKKREIVPEFYRELPLDERKALLEELKAISRGER